MHCRFDLFLRSGDVPEMNFVGLPGKVGMSYRRITNPKRQFTDIDIPPRISTGTFDAVEKDFHDATFRINNPSDMIPGIELNQATR